MTPPPLTNVTLDTNCLIDMEIGTGSASSLRAIAKLHHDGIVNLRVVAISGSERTQSGGYPESFAEFQRWISALGLDELDMLKPLAHLGLAYWDWCIWEADNGQDVALEQSIHAILFPAIEFRWDDYRRQQAIPDDAELDDRWRNAQCDVLALWSHIWHGSGIFVTSDHNFHKITKKPKLIALGATNILTPDDCFARLTEPTCARGGA